MAGLGRLGPAHMAEPQALGQARVQAGVDEGPGAHVLGFLLEPHHLGRLCVALEDGGQEGVRPRIELLDPDQGDVRRLLGRRARPAAALPRGRSSRWHSTMRRTAVGSSTVSSSMTCAKLPTSSSAKVERDAWARNIDLGVTTMSGRFGLARAWERSRWKYCAAVEGTVTRMLPRADSERKRSNAGRRVLGPLALVPVREQQDQTRVLSPLDLGGDQEVVDDDLGPVDEVAELRLPGDEGLGCLDRVAVLEADGGVLGEQRVAHGEVAHLPRRLERIGPDALQAVPDVGQGHVLLAVGVVHQDRMAVAEGAAAGVLAGETDVDALVHQRADGERFGRGPSRPGHSATSSSRWANWRSSFGWMVKPSGHRAHDRGEGVEHVGRDAGLRRGRVRRCRGRARAARSARARARRAPRRAPPAALR